MPTSKNMYVGKTWELPVSGFLRPIKAKPVISIASENNKNTPTFTNWLMPILFSFSIFKAFFKAFLFGIDKVKNSPHVTYRKASTFKISTEDGTIINLDGEKSDEGSFNFTVFPKAVKIIASKKSHKKINDYICMFL